MSFWNSYETSTCMLSNEAKAQGGKAHMFLQLKAFWSKLLNVYDLCICQKISEYILIHYHYKHIPHTQDLIAFLRGDC